MADRNLVLSLLITAKDQASAVLGKLYSWLNDATNVTAGLVRDAFSNLFSGGISSAADFEKTLDAVAAKGGYTREEMTRLTQAADQLGAEYGMAGGEVAKGMEILAAAGLSARDVIATLPPVLGLAKLEGISLDAASTKLADSLSIMGLSFEHAGRMADVLAKGANITLSTATQLADALTGAGGAATSYNAALAQTQQAYSDLTSGATAYERSVRDGAQRMGVSEAEYISYLNEHAVELQQLIPLELERLQTTTDAQAELLKQTQQKNEADQAGFDLAKTLAAAGVEAAEIKRLEALAAGDLTTALQIEAEQKQAATAATEDQTAAEQEHTEAAAQAAAETQRRAEAERQHAEQVQQLANAAAVFYSTLSQKAAQAWSYWDGLYFAVQAVSEPVFEAGNAFDQLAEKVRSNADNMYINLALATASIERAFFAQKQVLTDYADQLETAGYWIDRLAEKTAAGAVTMQDVALATRAAELELIPFTDRLYYNIF